MNLIQFGDALLRTQDLDPVYVALNNVRMPTWQKSQLLLAYWCFYHLGAAAYMAEMKDPKWFWKLMRTAARNKALDWPRGAERRHFRGAQSVSAVEELIQRYPSAQHAVHEWCDQSSFQEVSKAVQANRGFGNWIAFKIADMAERVLGYPVSFDDCELGIYKDPRKGAALARTGDQNYPITDQELKKTVDKYVEHWRKKKQKAPPSYSRLVNVQEIETIFCKYKSHVNGHYPLGKDITEVRHGLEGWGDLAQQLQRELPPWPV